MPTLMVSTLSPNPERMEDVKQYMEITAPLIDAAGGKRLKRGRVLRAVVGAPEFKLFAVFEFPSPEAIEAFFASESYKEVIPLRERAFTAFDIAIVEEF